MDGDRLAARRTSDNGLRAMEAFALFAMLTVSDPVMPSHRPFFLVNDYYLMLHQHNTARNYHEKWLKERWATLCKGGGRYQAMAEAYEMGRPDPCNGAKR